MSESENIATAAAPEAGAAPIDEEDRLRPEFVEQVLDAVAAGDNETARELVEPLHPADVADLIELAARDERDGLVRALAGIVDADVLVEMNDFVREGLLDALEPQQVADLAGQMETDDAVAILEDMDEEDQAEVLRSLPADERAAIEDVLTAAQIRRKNEHANRRWAERYEALAEKMRVYMNNGRAFREHDELFNDTSWYAVMNGQLPPPRLRHWPRPRSFCPGQVRIPMRPLRWPARKRTARRLPWA